MQDNAEQLLTEAISGDTEALSMLLRQHGPAVQEQLRIGAQWRSMIGSEDVMQITYLEAFIQISRFDPDRSPFQTWLRHIAENNLRDAIRGLSRQKHPHPANRVNASAGRSDSFMGLLETLGATSATPSRAAARHETQSLIETALAQLPDDYAKVVTLYDLKGTSIAEVAAALKRSPGAVHMLRARAHDCLRAILGRESIFFSHPA